MKSTHNLYIKTPGLEVSVPENIMPTMDEVNNHDLEDERKLFLDFDIGEDCMAFERRILRWNMADEAAGIEPEDRKPIWIYIHSYGGDLDYMWGIVDIIQTSKTPVYTVNVGRAASAAAIIFLAGHKRFMFPRSIVLIHEGSAQLSGDSTKVLDASDSYRKAIKQMKDYVLERTSIPSKLLNKKRNNDWELDSAFCLENGVCDQVVESLKEVI